MLSRRHRRRLRVRAHHRARRMGRGRRPLGHDAAVRSVHAVCARPNVVQKGSVSARDRRAYSVMRLCFFVLTRKFRVRTGRTGRLRSLTQLSGFETHVWKRGSDHPHEDGHEFARSSFRDSCGQSRKSLTVWQARDARVQTRARDILVWGRLAAVGEGSMGKVSGTRVFVSIRDHIEKNNRERLFLTLLSLSGHASYYTSFS